MPPRLRKLALTAHVACSVGWLGAVAAFLALAVVGLTSQDAQTVRGVYLVMQPAAWYILVPLAFASLLTGLIQSLGTVWGLFRHYWVLFKLVINLFANLVLLLYMDTFRVMADGAADPRADLSMVRSFSPLLHAVLALLLLLAATVLAVYKPRGMTQHGQRKQCERVALIPAASPSNHRRVSVDRVGAGEPNRPRGELDAHGLLAARTPRPELVFSRSAPAALAPAYWRRAQ